MSGPSPFTDADHRHMRAALQLAARGLGRVAPNPSVGCVLVRDGVVLARGWTQPGGRPHAEAEALRRAGEAARGATAYVTLEPCSHHGRTPPCADALITAGIARVVAALEDPDSRVAGSGLARLRAAGITVDTGLMAAEAEDLNRGFLLTRREDRPLVTLKLATSLDGAIATATGESRWITGPEARADAHLLRASHDAVLVGIGTALADDPALTVRLPGQSGPRWRVVLDGAGRLPATARLCDGSVPTLQITATDAPNPIPAGVTRLVVPRGADGRLSVSAALSTLAQAGVTRLMVEGGGAVAASLLRAGVVDRIVWYRAGLVLGGDARPGIAALDLAHLADGPRLRLRNRRILGPDIRDTFEIG